MTVDALLTELFGLGVDIWAEGNSLRYRAPKGTLTADLLDQIAAHRATLLDWLRLADGEEACYPLSYGQQSIYLTHQVAAREGPYTIMLGAQIPAAWDPCTLERLLNEVVARHTALRTVFSERDGVPLQRVRRAGHLPIEVVDAEGWGRAELDEHLAARAHEPFDLTQGPLLRAILFAGSAHGQILLLALHHIVADGQSVVILLRELAEAGRALRSGATHTPPAAQYVTFARWQARLGSSNEGERLWRYWEQQLGGSLPILELPVDRPRPPRQSYRGASYRVALDTSLSEGCRALALGSNCTLFVALLAAYQVLLYRYGGQEDILIGTPTLNRPEAEFDRIVGYCTNTVVLRTPLSPALPFRALLERTRGTVLEALAHQAYPFRLLVERLRPPRDLAHPPLFQTMFSLESTLWHRDRPSLAEGGFELYPVPVRAAPLDLALEVREVGRELFVEFRYNLDLFEAQTVARMGACFQTLLAAAVTDPDWPISRLPLLSAEERQQHRIWNRTAAPYPRETIQHRFETQVASTPHRIALIEAEVRIPYYALNEQANRLAGHLRAIGLAKGQRVAILLPRSIGQVAALLATLKVGCSYVPLDPAAPPERQAALLALAHPAALISLAYLLEALAWDGTHVLLDRHQAQIDAYPAGNLDVPGEPGDPAYMIFTSGSSGTPRGVLGTHRGILNRLAWMWDAYPFSAEEVCCHKTAPGFVDAVCEVWGPLLAGVPAAIAAQGDATDIWRLAALLERHRVTRIVLVPSLLAALLDHLPDLDRRLAALRLWMCSGEALPATLGYRFARHLPSAVLLNLYGTTEVAADATCYRLPSPQSPASARDQHQSADHRWLVPIGVPIANVVVHLLDAQLQPVPVGVPGEICVGGAGLAIGYLDQPDVTTDRFIVDPFDPAARLYRTGDRGRRRPDGVIEFLGRLDRQVQVRGQRVEPAELEAMLFAHPAVFQAAAAGLDEGNSTRLVAFVVPRDGCALDPIDLRRFLRARLPAYMVPHDIEIRGSLPHLASGKIDIRALLAEPKSPINAATAAPDALERGLLALWGRLFKRPSGLHDNFFDLGGHSLLALQVLDQVAVNYGVRLPIGVLYEGGSIAHLAAVLRAPKPLDGHSSLVPLQPHGEQPPFICAHPHTGTIDCYRQLAEALGPDQPFYAIQPQPSLGERWVDTPLVDLAAGYVRDIRALQPAGPYYLGGYSSGGTLAYEIAQQMRAQGQVVAILVLFDTICPVATLSAHPWALLPGCAQAWRHASIWRTLSARGALRHARIKASTATDRWRRHLLGRLGHPRQQSKHTLGRHWRWDYTPHRYLGHVAMFLATANPLGSEGTRDPRLAWQRYLDAKMDCYRLPGNHLDLLLDPAVLPGTTRHLRACLLAARLRSSHTPPGGSWAEAGSEPRPAPVTSDHS